MRRFNGRLISTILTAIVIMSGLCLPALAGENLAVTSIAELKGLYTAGASGSWGKYGALTDGTVCTVYDPTLDAPIVYHYDADSAQAGNDDTVVAPTNVSQGTAYTGDARWIKYPGASGVPDGGTEGQILVKQSSTDGDADWESADDAAVSYSPGNYTEADGTLGGHLQGIDSTFASQASLINSLIAVMENAGLDTTPPVLTRNLPVSSTPTVTADSLGIEYESSDPQGLAETDPVQWRIGAGEWSALTYDAENEVYEDTVAGFSAGENTLTVRSTNAAGGYTDDVLTVTYDLIPTLTSATIGNSGTSISLLFSEAVSVGAGGNGGWSIDMSGGSGEGLSYSSGSGTNTLVYTITGRTINSGETGTVAYTQPGNGIEDGSGNDVATIASASVTNNSSQSAGCSISDSFASDTSSHYTTLHGGITVTGGAAYGSSAWADNVVYYNVCTPGASAWVQADVIFPAQDIPYTGYVLCRVDTSSDTGYCAAFDHTSSHHRVILSKFSGTTRTAIGYGPDNFSAFADNSSHSIKLVTNGTSLKVYVDGSGTADIDITDNTYSAGDSIGMLWRVGSTSTAIDNFSGGSN